MKIKWNVFNHSKMFSTCFPCRSMKIILRYLRKLFTPWVWAVHKKNCTSALITNEITMNDSKELWLNWFPPLNFLFISDFPWWFFSINLTTYNFQWNIFSSIKNKVVQMTEVRMETSSKNVSNLTVYRQSEHNIFKVSVSIRKILAEN